MFLLSPLTPQSLSAEGRGEGEGKRARDRMKTPSIPARRPSAGAWRGPVRDLLGGKTSPAAFRFRLSPKTCGTHLLPARSLGKCHLRMLPSWWAVKQVLPSAATTTE
jgi:hypothetical protein